MRLIKRGFTLAEVLVTLVVIGAVAALTIPSLVNNIGDQQNKVAWRKAFSTLTQATMMIAADNGGSLVGAFPGDLAGTESLKNAFASKLNVIKNCSGDSSFGGHGLGVSAEGCWHNGNNSWYWLNGVGISGMQNPGLVLSNGSLMYFWNNKSDCSYDCINYTRCGEIYVDVNGLKRPNTVGKDIFHISIASSTLIPTGSRGRNDPSTTCIEGSTAINNNGSGCAAKYLYQ